MLGKETLRLSPSLILSRGLVPKALCSACWEGHLLLQLFLKGLVVCLDYLFSAYLCQVLCEAGSRVMMKTPPCSLFSCPCHSGHVPSLPHTKVVYGQVCTLVTCRRDVFDPIKKL